MLFFYGAGSSACGTFPLPGVACANCGTRDALDVVVFSRYFHIFWIPVFAAQKKAVTVCAHCQQALAQADWPPAYRQPGQALKRRARFPLINFIGLFIIGLLVLLGVGSNLLSPAGPAPESAQPTATDLLANPRRGDLYALQDEDSTRHLTGMKVYYVGPDTLFLMDDGSQLNREVLDTSSHDLQSIEISKTTLTRATAAAMRQAGRLTVTRP